MNALDARWLAACAVTETDQPHEWPHVMQVVVNRARSPRFPVSTIRDVVLQPLQFSWFNGKKVVDPGEVFAAKGCSLETIEAAVGCARWVLSLAEPLHEATHFWSPRSMEPPGRMPTWAREMRRFVPSGVDPWRFIFSCS